MTSSKRWKHGIDQPGQEFSIVRGVVSTSLPVCRRHDLPQEMHKIVESSEVVRILDDTKILMRTANVKQSAILSRNTSAAIF